MSGFFYQEPMHIQASQWLTMGACGISINMQTGEVVIPPGLPLSEASRAFWVAVAKAFPGAERQP